MASPITADFDISQQQLGDFGRLLSDIARVTGRELPEVIAQTAFIFLRSAAAGTRGPPRQGKKKRPIVRNPNRRKGQRRGKHGFHVSGSQYRITILTQTKPRFVWTDDKMDKRREIKRRGTAKNTWRGMMRQIGGTRKAAKSDTMFGGSAAQSAIARATKVRRWEGKDNAATELINSLSYMRKIAPRIMPSSLRKAQNQLEKRYLGKIAKAQAKEWQT